MKISKEKQDHIDYIINTEFTDEQLDKIIALLRMCVHKQNK